MPRRQSLADRLTAPAVAVGPVFSPALQRAIRTLWSAVPEHSHARQKSQAAKNLFALTRLLCLLLDFDLTIGLLLSQQLLLDLALVLDFRRLVHIVRDGP